MIDEDRGGLEESEGEDKLFGFPELSFEWDDEYDDKKSVSESDTPRDGVCVSQSKVFTCLSFFGIHQNSETITSQETRRKWKKHLICHIIMKQEPKD